MQKSTRGLKSVPHRVGRISNRTSCQDRRNCFQRRRTFEKKSTASHAREDYRWKRVTASKVWCSFQSKPHSLPKFSFYWTSKSLWYLSPFVKWPTWSVWTSGASSPAAAARLSQGEITLEEASFNASCSFSPGRLLDHMSSPEPRPTGWINGQ